MLWKKKGVWGHCFVHVKGSMSAKKKTKGKQAKRGFSEMRGAYYILWEQAPAGQKRLEETQGGVKIMMGENGEHK